MGQCWMDCCKTKGVDVLQEVLPHAKSEHFMTFQITNQDVHFDHVILSDKAVVKVWPKEFQAIVLKSEIT